jgi:hypothetical protein
MSRINKTRYEWIRENQITGQFTKKDIAVLDRLDRLDPIEPECDSNFPWGCPNVTKRYIIDQEEKCKKAWEKKENEMKNKEKILTFLKDK